MERSERVSVAGDQCRITACIDPRRGLIGQVILSQTESPDGLAELPYQEAPTGSELARLLYVTSHTFEVERLEPDPKPPRDSMLGRLVEWIEFQ